MAEYLATPPRAAKRPQAVVDGVDVRLQVAAALEAGVAAVARKLPRAVVGIIRGGLGDGAAQARCLRMRNWNVIVKLDSVICASVAHDGRPEPRRG